MASAATVDRSAFLRWAEKSLVPFAQAPVVSDELDAFGKMVGDATVVAIGEAVHGAAGPLEFRDRAFRSLVEQKGFTAIALESGLVESRIVHDYVRGKGSGLHETVRRGISWTFDRLPQNRSLIRWMREHNASAPEERPTNFYGFDVPGSPGNPTASRGPEAGLIDALEFLQRVDPASGVMLKGRIEPFLGNLQFDLCRSPDAPGYDLLTHIERDMLTAAIADLITLLERQQARYSTASSESDYQWALRAALGARQTDSWLRQIPPGWEPSSGPVRFPSELTSFYAAATEVRDRAQADNLDWIIGQEGNGGKIVVFASRYHLSAVPVKAAWAAWREQAVAGNYLRHRLGKALLSVCQLVGDRRSTDAVQMRGVDPNESLDDLVATLGVSRFLLDLRNAPPGIARWLAQDFVLGRGSEQLKVAVGKAFDVVLYLDDTSVMPVWP